MSVKQPDHLMPEFEKKLTQAMRPVEAPDGFAARILERSQPKAPTRARIFTMPFTHLWASGAIAAALLAGVFLGEQMHVRHQREQAQLAQQQFEAAMRITNQTLDNVRLQLQQAGVTIGN
jgi:lysyl-tRNA synthetase class I